MRSCMERPAAAPARRISSGAPSSWPSAFTRIALDPNRRALPCTRRSPSTHTRSGDATRDGDAVRLLRRSTPSGAWMADETDPISTRKAAVLSLSAAGLFLN